LTIEVLLKPKAIEILEAVGDRSMSIKELLDAVGGSATTIVKRVRELEEMGLVKVDFDLNFPFKKKVSITRKGLSVLKTINKLKNKLDRGY